MRFRVSLSRMIRRFPFSLFLVASLITIAGAQTPPGVNVKLSFAEKKTVYRIGEPIKVVMEFTADREGYTVEVHPDDTEPGSDTVVISPDVGFRRWYEEFNENFMRCVISRAKLTATPQRVEITLNDRLRFDSPGQYAMSVTTRRVSPDPQTIAESSPFNVSTNPLKFEIVSMNEADEGKRVKRLSELLDANRNTQNQDLSKQLSYLTGDPSAREKVRRFLNPEQNSSGRIWHGLFIARNRALVVNLLETALRDPNIPVTFQLLSATARLKLLLTDGPRDKSVNPAPGLLVNGESPRIREIRDEYLAEVAAGLAKRTGNNQTTSAFTILTSASADSQTANAGKRDALQILIQQFDSLDPIAQELLLRGHWEVMRDAALIPSLKKLLAKTDRMSKGIRGTTLNRLMELAPDEARPYVIAEIRDPRSAVEPKILGALEDKSLPEVDAALLDHVRRAATSTENLDRIFLKFKLDVLVRFATDSIYQELMEVYRKVGETLPPDAQAGFLAYFAKHNEQEAIPMIEKVVGEFKPGESTWILSDLTKLYYSDAIGVILKKLLESDDYTHASHAAYLIGREGTAGDERVLEARLKRWREGWRDRVAEADAQNQGQVERELISALIKGKSWKLPPERVEELRNSCITNLCKQSNLVPQ